MPLRPNTERLHDVLPKQHDAELSPSILTKAKTIALVGASPKEARPSYRVMAYLQQARVIKVLPSIPVRKANRSLVKRCLCQSAQIDPCRWIWWISSDAAEFVPEIVEEALSIKAKTIWMQLGITMKQPRMAASDGRSRRRHGPLHENRTCPSDRI